MRRRKHHIVGKLFLFVVLVAIVGGFVFKDQIIKAAERKAANIAIEKALDAQIASDDSVGDVSAKEILNQMDDADKEKIETMVTENLTQENIEAAEGYIKSGDISGLKTYVQENISTEDAETLTQLYDKYKDQIQ